MSESETGLMMQQLLTGFYFSKSFSNSSITLSLRNLSLYSNQSVIL